VASPFPAAAWHPSGMLRFGRCEVRPAQREVLVDGAARELQPRAFDLLLYLIEHREQVLSPRELLGAVWGPRVERLQGRLDRSARIFRYPS
jgi:DNA-binding response OmpR family regulator